MGIEEKITGDVLTRLQDFSRAPLLTDEKPYREQPQEMRYARKGGGYGASRPVEQLGVRLRNVSVRVLEREKIGRPVKGDRKRLGSHTYGVAEYRGNRCFRVISGTDSLLVATEVAGRVAADLGRNAEIIILPKSKRRTPKKTNYATKKPRLPEPKRPTKRAASTADAQRLHMRDIDRQGKCMACEMGPDDRNTKCGSKPIKEITPQPVTPQPSNAPKTLLDALAATAHLRGE